MEIVECFEIQFDFFNGLSANSTLNNDFRLYIKSQFRFRLISDETLRLTSVFSQKSKLKSNRYMSGIKF